MNLLGSGRAELLEQVLLLPSHAHRGVLRVSLLGGLVLDHHHLPQPVVDRLGDPRLLQYRDWREVIRLNLGRLKLSAQISALVEKG